MKRGPRVCVLLLFAGVALGALDFDVRPAPEVSGRPNGVRPQAVPSDRSAPGRRDHHLRAFWLKSTEHRGSWATRSGPVVGSIGGSRPGSSRRRAPLLLGSVGSVPAVPGAPRRNERYHVTSPRFEWRPPVARIPWIASTRARLGRRGHACAGSDGRRRRGERTRSFLETAGVDGTATAGGRRGIAAIVADRGVQPSRLT
jgi:hypothetical protein